MSCPGEAMKNIMEDALRPEVTYFRVDKKKIGLLTRGTKHSIGYDLYPFVDVDVLELKPNQSETIRTGIHLIIPEGYYAEIVGRSSLNSKGILVPTGIIDNDYTGELKVVIRNHNKETFTYPSCLAIAQLVIKKQEDPIINPIDYDGFQKLKEKKQSERDSKGFGSTNKPTFLETLKNAVEGEEEEKDQWGRDPRGLL